MKRVVLEHNAKGQVRGLYISCRLGVWYLYGSREHRRRNWCITYSTSLAALLDYVYTPDV